MNKRGNAALLIILAAAIVLVLLIAPSAMKQVKKHSKKAVGESVISRLSFFNMDLTMGPAFESKTVYEFMADSEAAHGEFKIISAEKILFPKITKSLHKDNPEWQVNLFFTKAYENPNSNKLEYPPLDSAFETWSMDMDMWDRASLFFWTNEEAERQYDKYLRFPLIWTKTPERYDNRRFMLQTMWERKIIPEEHFQKYMTAVKDWLSIKSYDKEKLRQMLSSVDRSEKELAVRLIGALKYRDFNKELIEIIQTKNSTNPGSITLRVMGIIGDEEFVDPIIEFSPDSLAPLGRIGNDKAVAWLANKLKNPKGDGYFQGTLRALATTGNPKALEALKKHKENAKLSQNDLLHLDSAIRRLESGL